MDRSRIVAFDVDPESLASIGQAFPEWEIDVRDGAHPASLAQDGDAAAAGLFVVGMRDRVAETLTLCRGLRSRNAPAHPPLLVLVSPGQDALVRAALEAGATSCLVIPIHAKELTTMVTRARAGNRPGHHTLDLDRAQLENPWQDEGGEA